MNRIRKRVSILMAVIAFTLVAIFATQTPLRDAYAAKRVVKLSYISELIMITEEQLNEHKGDDNTVIVGDDTYKLVTETVTKLVDDKEVSTVVPSPIYKGKTDKMTSTYLAYKTTTVPQEAITDIRFMNMEGGWSFSDYDELLDDLKAKAKDVLTMLLPSIAEYQENYALASGRAKEAAVYAHDLMNVFKYDDNGENIKVGDLLLRDDIAVVDNELLTTMFMQSNLGILDTIYTALSIACSIDEDDETFLDKLENLTNPQSYSDRTDLNDYAYVLQDDFAYLREAISFYQNSGKTYDGFTSEEDRNKYIISLASGAKGSRNSTLWTDGYSAEIVLKQINYEGVSNSFNTLYDMVMGKNFDTLNVNEYYPLIACMSEGTRGTLMLGLLETVKNATLDPEHYHDIFDKLNQDDTKDIVEEGISVFFGVNREIYEDHAVAMTTTATGGNKAGDKSWTELQAELEDSEREKVNKT
ncbi:MAG: hypothetical protein MJ072_02050, partial [Clostridia bacterium]|nr:hypothetical protein [Clostridia bacterium]